MIWDRGTWTATGDAATGLANGHLKFVLAGKRMRGQWALIRLKENGARESWLLIKDRDPYAEDDDTLTERCASSVVTGRTFADISSGKPANPGKPVRTPPAFLSLMLCDTASKPPAGADWQFEMKYDGYRLQVAIGDGTAVLRTRTGLDWTDRFPDVANAAQSLDMPDTILDGEAVVRNKHGISDYPGLVTALGAGGSGIVFVAFDVLRLKGKDMTSIILSKRRRSLEKLLAGKSTGAIRLAPALTGDGDALLARVISAGGEGLIAKRTGSAYYARRSSSWVKIKGVQSTAATVIGWMPSPAGRSFASLLVALPTDGRLRYAGRVGSGFSARSETEAFARLQRLERKTPPPGISDLEVPKGARWVTPEHAINIGFGGYTGNGRLRAARFLGWHTAEAARPVGTATLVTQPQKLRKEEAARDDHPITITHPARVVFPEVAVTKGDIAAYYQKIAPRMLPHLQGRPASILRAPDGIGGETFFQRHAMPAMKRGIERIPDPDGNRAAHFCIRDATGLASAVQLGAIEFHDWGARLPDLTVRDRMIFDLDPADDVPFSAVKSAAELIRRILATAGLKSFAMVSGGKGVHVVVPLSGQRGWSDVETFTRGLAHMLARSEPDRYVAVMSKSRRHGRIFIDWLRNKQSATAISPYSIRARPTASLAMPVSWQQLEGLQSAAAFTAQMETIPAVDPWRGFAKQQTMSQSVLNVLPKFV